MTRPPWLAFGQTEPKNLEMEQAFAKAREAARLDRLSDGTAAAFGDTLRRAGVIARTMPPKGPCDYDPWRVAFAKVHLAEGVMEGLIYEASVPPWPSDPREAIDFALTVLEEDPMYFRSGYTKRHLVNRLRQQVLSPAQSARADTILRRVVVQGTGLEEFRAFCKLAAKLRPQGLQAWLEQMAEGVLLTTQDLDIGLWRKLGADKLAKLTQHYGSGWTGLVQKQPEWAVVGANPDFPLHRLSPEEWADPALKSRRNAWRMLNAVRRAETMAHSHALRQDTRP